MFVISKYDQNNDTGKLFFACNSGVFLLLDEKKFPLTKSCYEHITITDMPCLSKCIPKSYLDV